MKDLSHLTTDELLWRGEQIGVELAEIGRVLFARGEQHEARHILAALLSGNTQNCDETCPLHFANPELTIMPPVSSDGPA